MEVSAFRAKVWHSEDGKLLSNCCAPLLSLARDAMMAEDDVLSLRQKNRLEYVNGNPYIEEAKLKNDLLCARRHTLINTHKCNEPG